RRLDADALEDAIWQGMTSYGSRLLQQLAEKPVGEAGDRRSRLDRITRAQGHLLDALAEGLGDPAVIRRRLRALEEERRALDPFLSPPSAPSGRVFGWEEIPVYWRREILEVLVRGIVVGDGQLTIVLKTDSENISAARMTVPTRC
ncbi:MAG: recombinase family protein, partial [Sulfobacillus sp.]|nr:recombinase family protein [Sulfobacillus sp.]